MVNLTVILNMYGWNGIPEVFSVMMMFFLIPFFLLPVIFFLLTLQKALQRCSLRSRVMEPGQVWLLLIPVFNLVWQFILVSNVATSLGNEFRARNMVREAEPGKALGHAYCILGLCSVIPFVGILTSIAALICWILYWVKIAGYSSELAYPQQY
jgi:hypothetical protein